MYEDVLNDILAQRAKEMLRLRRIDAYLRGNHDRPYMPKSATVEYRGLIAKSIANWLPLVVTIPAQSLYVEGYRDPSSKDMHPAWEFWSPNGMAARQHSIHRGALGYGVHYAVVLPGTRNGKSVPSIRPVSAMAMTAVYDDELDDDWPVYAIQEKRAFIDGEYVTRHELYDSYEIHDFIGDGQLNGSSTYIGSREHGLGVCPVVRFRNELPISPTMPPSGEVESLIPLQDRLNETVLGLMMAQTYAAHRQRWATGLAIPEVEVTDPVTGETSMQPVEPFNAAVNRLWVSDDPDVKFGEFEQTDLKGYLDSYENGLMALAAISQIPPFFLIGHISNLSADALVALQSGSEHRNNERRTLFGTAYDQLFRLASTAAGETPDESATVVWRDTEAKNLAAVADALGKIATQLQVPPQALWEKIPGVFPEDVDAWREMAKEADPMGQLNSLMRQQALPQPGQMPMQGKGEMPGGRMAA